MAPVRPVTFTQPAPKKNKTALIVILVIVFGALAGGAAFLIMNINRESADERIGRLMREAAGVQPIKKSFFSKDQQFDDAFREQFRNLFQTNKDFQARAALIDESELAKVGSPESFADPEYAANGLRQLHASYDLDKEMEEKVLEIAGNLRQAIENTDWSASRKQEAMAGFDRGFSNALNKRQGLINAEKTYVDATDDIYNYASTYHYAMQLDGGHLRIADETVLQTFNSKIHQYNECRTALLQAKDDFTRFQSDLLNRMGVGSKDVGLK